MIPNKTQFLAKSSTAKNSGVLFLLNSLGVGGSERKVVRIANALSAKGRHIELAYLNAPETLLEHLSSTVSVAHLKRRGKFSITAVRRLSEQLTKGRTRCLVCVNLYPLLYGFAARIFFGHKDMRIVALLNTTEFGSAKGERQMFFYKPLLRRVSLRVFGSYHQRNLWVERYRLPLDNTVVIHNGVDTAYFNQSAVEQNETTKIRNLYALDSADIVVCMVGQLRPEKGHEYLLKAARNIIDRGIKIKVIVIGDGECRMQIERGIADLGLSGAVILAGEQEDVRPFLSAVDFFVLTSISETFSNAALEAMAMAKAVILSDFPSASEMVTEGDNGFLFSPGDVEGLTSCLIRCIESPGLASTMGARALNRVESEFTFEKLVERYDQLLFGADH